MDSQTLEKNYINLFESVKKLSGSRRVNILAVSKKQPLWKLTRLYEKFQHVNFGENYLTELKQKVKDLPSNFQWTYLGQIQHNHWRTLKKLNVRLGAVDHDGVFEWAEKAPPAVPLSCLIQVALEVQPGRGGCSFSEAERLCREFASFAHLRIKGIMFMPLERRSPEERRLQFREVHSFFKSLQAYFPQERQLDTLSQGMSDDFQFAIEEGATEVRVGTLIFGERSK